MTELRSPTAQSFRRRRDDQLLQHPFCYPCSEAGHTVKAIEVVSIGAALLSVCGKHAVAYRRTPPRW